MDVTKENFKKAYCLLEKHLSNADFVAIDAEFSGLSTKKGSRHSFQTLEENYLKTKGGSDQFLILQYGICLFTWNDEVNRYTVLPFTFNIYPRPYKRFFNDVMFMVQSSCLDFLSQNNFDFNKLFYDGISFVHPSTQNKVKEKYEGSTEMITKKEKKFSENAQNATPKATPKAIPKEDSKVFVPKDKRDFMVQITSSVEEFIIDSEKSSLNLPPCNPFERKLIYEVLEERYPMGLYLQSEVNENKEKFVKVVKITEKGKSMKLQEDLLEENEFYNQISAFNLIMKLLVHAQKPIIGHNMNLDLFYTVSNFFATPPDSLDDYKSLLNGLFPTIFDTKVISSTKPLSGMLTTGTALKSLTESIGVDLVPVEIDFDESVKEKANNQTSYHDAGFDALSTGKCFISLIKSLMMHFDKGDGRIEMTGNLLKPFQNRIFIMGINDINYMTVHKKDDLPSRRGVYHVTFPSEWRESDLHNLFSPISKLLYPITWINGTSAYVSIQDKSKHDIVMEQFVLDNKHSKVFQIKPFPESKPEEEEKVKQPNENQSLKRKLISYESESDPEDGEISSDENANDSGEDKKKVKEPESKKQAMFDISEDW